MKSPKSKCRICLQYRQNIKDLSDPKNKIGHLQIQLQTAFFDLTGILVSSTDDARQVCSGCTRKFQSAVDFQHAAKRSHEEILKQLAAGIWTETEELKEIEKVIVKDEEDENFYEDPGICEVKLEESMDEEEEIKPEPHKYDAPDDIEFDQQEILRLGLKRFKRTGGSFVCEVCGFETAESEMTVMRHIKSSHLIGIKPKRRNIVINNDSRWVRRQLRRGKMLICDHCQQEFNSYTHLHSHMRKFHIDVCPYKCPWDGCLKAFRSQLMLDRHVNCRHFNKSMCEVCGRNILKSSMKDHLKLHKPDRPFACQIEGCTAAFKDKNGLTQHLGTVHSKARNFACDTCGKNYKTKPNLTAHIRKNHTLENCVQCPTCLKWHLNPNQLQIHINEVHLNLRPCPCEFCGSNHKSQTKLYRHLRQMHPEQYQLLLSSGKLKCRKKIEAKK